MSRPAPLHVDGFSANNPHLAEQFAMVPQGISADLIATLGGFSRSQCDELAVDSQNRARVAIAEGRFDRSLVPISHDDGTVALAVDEHPRAGTDLDKLGQARPGVRRRWAPTSSSTSGLSLDQTALLAYPQLDHIDHVHHGGNSSGVVDGAAAVLLASREAAEANGWTPRARIVMSAVAGTEPVIMLTAPGPATAKVLDRAGMTLDDIDLFEVNEAFASVVLQTGSPTRGPTGTRSTSTAAPWPWATPSAPPGPCSSAPCSTSSSAGTCRPAW